MNIDKNHIHIHGVRENYLKNITLSIPKRKVTVFLVYRLRPVQRLSWLLRDEPFFLDNY